MTCLRDVEQALTLMDIDCGGIGNLVYEQTLLKLITDTRRGVCLTHDTISRKSSIPGEAGNAVNCRFECNVCDGTSSMS